MLSEVFYGLETRSSPANVRRKTPVPDAGSRPDRAHSADPRPALYGDVAFLPLPVLPRLPFRPHRRRLPPARQSRVCGIALNRCTSHDFSGLSACGNRIRRLFWGEHAIGCSFLLIRRPVAIPGSPSAPVFRGRSPLRSEERRGSTYWRASSSECVFFAVPGRATGSDRARYAGNSNVLSFSHLLSADYTPN